jgi:hypothetical protein
MSDIEDEVKPILSPLIKNCEPFLFLPSHMAALSVFAFEKAVISDHMDGKRKPFFTVAQRTSFKRNLTIPDGIQVWIASVGNEYFNGIFQSYIFEVGKNSKPLKDIKFLSFTWSAGYFVLQLLAMRWKNPASKPKNLPGFLSPSHEWNRASLRIWPNNGKPLAWNRTHHLSGKALQVFTNRWQAPVITFE